MSVAVLGIPTTYLVDRKYPARIHLKRQTTLIGRETGFRAEGISRRHCVIRFHEEHFYVADMDSRYGTYLNGKKLPPKQWQVINAGDHLRVGVMGFQLEIPKARPPRPEPPKVTRFLPSDSGTETLTAISLAKLPPPAAPALSEAKSEDTVEPALPAPLAESDVPALGSAAYRWRFMAWFCDALVMKLAWSVLLRMQPRPSLALAAFELLALIALFLILPTQLFGQTLAKKVMGLKVLLQDGEPLTWKAVWLREVACKLLIPAALVAVLACLAASRAIFLGAAVVLPVLLIGLTMGNGMFFWDKIAGTRVISEFRDSSAESD